MDIQRFKELNSLMKKIKQFKELMLIAKGTDFKKEIEYGCLVRYKNIDDTFSEGRVIKKGKADKIEVKIDKRISLRTFDLNELENLSNNIYGELEKQQRIHPMSLERSLNELNKRNFEQFEFDVSDEEQILRLEILMVANIINTSWKVITYKQEGVNEINKVISNSNVLKDLKEGLYLFKFNYGFIEYITKINN